LASRSARPVRLAGGGALEGGRGSAADVPDGGGEV
jgi:hypothetical protein